MLTIQELHLDFAQSVLKDVSFEVPEGQICGIVGPSGGGKSSLLKIVAGLLDAGSGQVFWNGKRVKGPSEQLIPGHPDIQLVNQDFGLDPYHTVGENIVQKMLYLPRDVRSRFTEELLDLVELTPLRNQQAIFLSGGEQQRLAIARALAVEPDLLLLDEPFSHLDAHLKIKIGNYLRALTTTRNMSCMLVSHEGQDILQWCAKIHFMTEGRIQRTDTATAFYFQPTSAYEALFFGEINCCQDASGKEILFRPNEYRLVETGEGIPVQLVDTLFSGAYWRNTVCTNRNESLVLFAQEPLHHVKEIQIHKRYS